MGIHDNILVRSRSAIIMGPSTYRHGWCRDAGLTWGNLPTPDYVSKIRRYTEVPSWKKVHSMSCKLHYFKHFASTAKIMSKTNWSISSLSLTCRKCNKCVNKSEKNVYKRVWTAVSKNQCYITEIWASFYKNIMKNCQFQSRRSLLLISHFQGS